MYRILCALETTRPMQHLLGVFTCNSERQTPQLLHPRLQYIRPRRKYRQDEVYRQTNNTHQQQQSFMTRQEVLQSLLKILTDCCVRCVAFTGYTPPCCYGTFIGYSRYIVFTGYVRFVSFALVTKDVLHRTCRLQSTWQVKENLVKRVA